MGARRLAGLTIVGTLAAGCGASQTYPGPRRPPSAVATLVSEDTKIDAFDDRQFIFSSRTGGQLLEILPGPHALSVKVFVSDGSAGLPTFRQSDVRLICFDALPGHAYVARPVQDGTFKQPELFDETAGAAVAGECPRAADDPPR